MFKIKKSENSDTRSATGKVTKEDLLLNSENHINDVATLMNYCGEGLIQRGVEHDWTKTKFIDEFYSDFEKAQDFGANFTKLDWYQLHIRKERHHISERFPKNVNLFDLFEMICDNVAAGLARSGKFRDIVISNEILQAAIKNTADLLIDKCEVDEL